MFAVATLLLAAQLVGAPPGAAGQDAAAQKPLTLSIAYADGRTVRHVVTARATSVWTPMFPRSTDWRSAEGLAVSAVHYQHVLEGAGVRVKVSVLLGQPHQKEIPVANELVEWERPVGLPILQDFGVAPVRLTLEEFDAPVLHQPRVENKTAALQVEAVDVVPDGAPGYRVTVRNHGARPVMTFHVETYRGGQRHSSSPRGERDGTPAVAPGGTYAFLLRWEQPPDVIGITGLMFEDGSIEGDPAGVATSRLLYLGRSLQLSRVLAIFRESARPAVADDPAGTIATLAARIETLSVLPDAAARQHGGQLLPPEGPVSSIEAIDGAIAAAMLEVRRGVLSDLQSAPRDREGFDRWIQVITAQYVGWYQRFVELTAR